MRFIAISAGEQEGVAVLQAEFFFVIIINLETLCVVDKYIPFCKQPPLNLFKSENKFCNLAKLLAYFQCIT